MVPKGWYLKSLCEIAEINPRKPDRPNDGLVSFIPMDAVSESATVLHLEDRCYEDVEKGFTSFKDRDVLVAKITPCFENGKGAIVEGLTNGIGFGSTEFHVLRATPDASPSFIYYVTNTEQFRIKGEANMQGSAGQKRVTTDYLKILKILVPPISEQRKIAQILSTWDKAIATTERLLANKQQQKKALMQRLLTGKQRFAGFEGEWRICHLRDIVTLEYGKSPKDIVDIDGEYPIVGTGGISGLTNQPLVTQSSVVVGRKGTIDKPALLQVPFWPIDTVFYCLAKPSIDITWFYYWISSLQLKKYNESSGLPSLSRETLYSIKVSVPPFDEQQTISSVLAKADAELSIIQ